MSPITGIDASIFGEREPDFPVFNAIYARFSSRSQDTAGQEADLKRWAKKRLGNLPNRWYRDTFTDRTTDRPGFQKLMGDIQAGRIIRLVVWRLDRLGCTAKGLTDLFELLTWRGVVKLISLRDDLELGSKDVSLMAHVLASVAAYETEVRAERIKAGQATARAAGKTWGGSPPGRRLKVTAEQEKIVRRLDGEGEGVVKIARATGLSRPTIYRILKSGVPAESASGASKGRGKEPDGTETAVI